MKYRILMFALCLGILVGVTLFGPTEITGAATDCYAFNELCECDEIECICGDRTISAEYCESTQFS